MKCILFDLDGTLVSTGGAGVTALEKAFVQTHGISEALKDIDPAGKTDPAIIREIFRQKRNQECTEAEMIQVQERYLENLPEECQHASAYEVMRGIPEILEHLQQKEHILIGLGTGNLERGARIKLDRSGLNPFFAFGGYGSDSENRTALLKIARSKAEEHSKQTLSEDQVFIVGDTFRDIRAAREAGFKVIAVATGHSSFDELQQHNPDFCLQNFESPKEFLRIIEG